MKRCSECQCIITSAKQLAWHAANCCFNSCAEQSHSDSVRKASVEEQLSSETVHRVMRAQLQLLLLDGDDDDDDDDDEVMLNVLRCQLTYLGTSCKPEGSLGRTAYRTATSTLTHTAPELCLLTASPGLFSLADFKFQCCFTSTKTIGLIRDWEPRISQEVSRFGPAVRL